MTMETHTLMNEDPCLERNFHGHRGSVMTVDFSPNQQQLASGSADKTVIVWNLKRGMRSFRYSGHEDIVTSVHFSPSGHLLASACKDSTCRLWVPKIAGDSVWFRAHHSGRVRCVRFSPCGEQLLTCGDDKAVKLWSAHRPRLLTSYTRHVNWVRSVSFSPDGRLLVSGSDDKTVRVWEKRSANCVHSFTTRSTGYVSSVEFHPTGTCVSATSSDGTLRLWDVRTNRLLQHYTVEARSGAVASGGGATSHSHHPLGKYAVVSCGDGALRVLDLLEGRPICTLHAHTSVCEQVVFSRCGTHFASCGGGGGEKEVLVWRGNLLSCDLPAPLPPHTSHTSHTSRPDIHDVYPRNVPTAQMAANSRRPVAISSGFGAHSSCHHPYPTTASCEQIRAKTNVKQGGEHADTQQHNEQWEHQRHTETETSNERQQLNTIQQTMEQVVEQLRMLTQTVDLVERRLTRVEGRLDSVETRVGLSVTTGQRDHAHKTMGKQSKHRNKGESKQRDERSPSQQHPLWHDGVLITNGDAHSGLYDYTRSDKEERSDYANTQQAHTDKLYTNMDNVSSDSGSDSVLGERAASDGGITTQRLNNATGRSNIAPSSSSSSSSTIDDGDVIDGTVGSGHDESYVRELN